jgi:hypothetical protein
VNGAVTPINGGEEEMRGSGSLSYRGKRSEACAAAAAWASGGAGSSGRP